MSLLRSLAAAALLAVTVPACDAGDESAETQDNTAATGRFELSVGEDGKHYFQLLATNGERLLGSEGYSSLKAARSGIKSVQANGAGDRGYELNRADNGEHYFNVVATNGQIVGTSETYATKQAAQRGIAAVKRALTNPTSADAEAGARFQTLRGADGKHYFNLRAANGRIVMQSQGYSSKSAAERGVTAVKKAAVDADRFEVFEGVDGQHTFRLRALNGEILGRGEMYATKSTAYRASAGVREIVREMTSAGEVTDLAIQGEIERAADGLTYMSESDYPYSFVIAEGRGDEVSEAAVRELLGSYTDADPDADKPMADLFAMESTWEEWQGDERGCEDVEDDPDSLEQCLKTRSLEQVISANLSDVKVFYFGSYGEPGMVDGVGVSVFIVGRTPEGSLAGVRTLAIWT